MLKKQLLTLMARVLPYYPLTLVINLNLTESWELKGLIYKFQPNG